MEDIYFKLSNYLITSADLSELIKIFNNKVIDLENITGKKHDFYYELKINNDVYTFNIRCKVFKINVKDSGMNEIIAKARAFNLTISLIENLINEVNEERSERSELTIIEEESDERSERSELNERSELSDECYV